MISSGCPHCQNGIGTGETGIGFDTPQATTHQSNQTGPIPVPDSFVPAPAPPSQETPSEAPENDPVPMPNSAEAVEPISYRKAESVLPPATSEIVQASAESLVQSEVVAKTARRPPQATPLIERVGEDDDESTAILPTTVMRKRIQ